MIKKIHNMLASKEISCKELTTKYLEEIEKSNGELNAYVNVTGEVALAQAEKVDEKIAKGQEIGLLEGDDIYIIRSSEVPVALIEVGFMTNRSELEKLSSQDYQEKAAKGIYNAILEAFEKGY